MTASDDPIAQRLRAAATADLADATATHTGAPLVVTGWTIATAQTCLASTIDSPFAWSAFTVRRVLALAITRAVVEEGLGLRDATIAAVSRMARARTPGRARVTANEWLADADPAERAMAAAGAAELAAKLVPLLKGTRVRAWAPGWFWRHPSGRVVLHGRAWVTTQAPNGGVAHLTVERGGEADAPTLRTAMDVALVVTLATGTRPDWCGAMRPDSGRHALVAPDAAAHQALTAATAAAHALALRAAGQPVPTTPGPHCDGCAQLPDCPAGRDHLHPDEEAF